MESGDFPDFIGIGAAKSGTTWLSVNLGKHPDVYIPSRKELSSFAYNEFNSDCIENYKKYFQNASRNSIKGEFSTIYLQSEVAPPRIRSILPNVKLIVCLRNPVEQIYSHYWHLRRQNFHQGERQSIDLNIEHALAEYHDLLVEPAFYFKHLKRWKTYFPEHQFLEIFFDDIVSSPATVLKRTMSFLDIDCEDWLRSRNDKLVHIEREGVSPRGNRTEILYGYLYVFLVKYIYNPMKSVFGPRYAASVKDNLRLRQAMECMFFRRGYPAMTDKVHELLVEHVAGEIDGLSRMTGRDLSHWLRSPQAKA
jgi:Sulfotransferase domain